MKQINFIYTTRRGTFFHLSPTNQNNLNLDNVLISVGDFAHMERVLQKLVNENITFKKYIGIDEKCKTYLTAVDSYKPRCIEGSHLSMNIKLW